MKRYVILIIFATLFLMASMSYAAGLFVKENRYSSELVLEGIGNHVSGIDKKDDRLIILFKNQIGKSSKNPINAKFFTDIEKKDKSIIINFEKDVDYAVLKEGKNIRVVASKKAENTDVKLNYDVEKPLIKKGTKIKENAEAERLLGLIDDNIAQTKYKTAIFYIDQLNAATDNKFYKQESLFREGKINFLMNDLNGFTRASELFDEFVKLYPDSYKMLEAMDMSAKSKANAELYHEAIEVYNKMLTIITDPDKSREILDKLAELYAEIAQYKDAVKIRTEIAAKFPESALEQTIRIGVLKLKMNDPDGAYQNFLSVAKNDFNMKIIDDETLFLMGRVLEDNTQYEKAHEIFTSIHTNNPQGNFSDLAMFRSGITLEKLGRGKEADKILQETITIYEGKDGALLSALAYARKHLKTNTYTFWREYLSTPLASKDFDISSNAKATLIQSLYNDKETEEAEKEIESFMRDNFGSPLMNEVSQVLQRIKLDKAKDAFTENKLDESMKISNEVMEDYPDSPFITEAKKLYQDALYKKTLEKFGTDDYEKAIEEIEGFYAGEEKVMESDRWKTLLDESYYKQTKKYFDEKQYERVLVSTGQYFVNISNGQHKDAMRKLYEDSLESIIDSYFAKRDFLGLVRRYDENENLIKDSVSQPFKDKVMAYVAYTSNKNGLTDKAGKLMSQIKDKTTPMYIVTDILLNNSKGSNDINNLPVDKLDLLASDLEEINLDLTMSLLDDYTKDKKEALRIKFRLSKIIFNDLKRENVLLNIYNALGDPKNEFKGSAEVYLSIGILYFNKNNFTEAKTALEKFIVKYTERDGKRAEGLYYLGKTLRKSGDDKQASKHFLEAVETIPGSVFANASKKELEDIKWYESIR